MQQSAGEEQFGVDVGALELAEGATVDVGPVAVVEQGLREDASGAFLSGSGEHAAGRGEERRRQVGVAPRMHAEGEPQSLGVRDRSDDHEVPQMTHLNENVQRVLRDCLAAGRLSGTIRCSARRYRLGKWDICRARAGGLPTADSR